MQFIKNNEDGCCSSIAFYQFVKCCPTLTYYSVYSLIYISLPDDKIKYLNNISPLIKQYYELIQSSRISVSDLPSGAHPKYFPLPLNKLDSELKAFGLSEYGYICWFCRYLCFAWSGIWVGNLLGERLTSADLYIDPLMSTDYTSFMESNHILFIPRICYLVWTDEQDVVEDDFHTVILVDSKLYDSNDDSPSLVSNISAVYKAWY